MGQARRLASAYGILCLVVVSGCATVPNAKEIVEAAYAARQPPAIIGAGGRLSPEESRETLAALQSRVESTDILERHTAVMELVGAAPLVKDNRATLLVDGPRTYDAMFRAIAAARHSIDFETFIFQDDDVGKKLANLLRSRQSEGVSVRVIYDSIGSIHTPHSFFKQLRDGGIQVLEFNPVDPLKAGGRWRLINRDHRKMLIADGKVAITGGVNISEEYSSRLSGPEDEDSGREGWRDTDVQIEGPAVAEFQDLFIDTWKRQKGPGPPEARYAPDFVERPGWNDLVRVVGSTPGDQNRLTYLMYLSAFVYARNTIHLTSAYFVPDRQTVEALTDAARRGVDVQIVLPGGTDIPMTQYAGRYYYTQLLRAGVKLYEHRSAVLHAKTAVVDGVWSTVGSTNMDMWSFARNDEVNTVVLSRQFAKQMEDMFAQDLSDSREIRREEWAERPLLPRIREWFGHLVSPWL
ncbi:MAG: cardiolipin synthase [Gemmatimonadota bacterium]